MENSLDVPQKTKNRVAIWSSNPTPGHVSTQNYNLKRYMHPSVHSTTTYNSRDMETIQMSTDRWTDKEDVLCVYIYNGIYIYIYIYIYTIEYYSAIKKNEIMPFAETWMDLEIIILSEVRKTNAIWYHLCVESKIWHKCTYSPSRNRCTDIEQRLVVARGRGNGGGMDCHDEGWGSLGLADANYYT